MKYGKHKWRRTFVMDKFASNKAELKAAEYCLRSINVECVEQLSANLLVTKQYIKKIFDKRNGEWSISSRMYQPLFDVVRDISGKFKSFKVNISKEDKTLGELKDIIEETAKSNTEIFDK